MRLCLKRHEDRRIRAGHLWIYSNEVDVAKTPLDRFTPGQLVVIENHQGKILGTGYVNPHSLICARLISREPQQFLDEALLIQRIQNALQLRESIFNKPYYRLVFGESDLLPGLVIDRYGDVLVVQITTAGMEQAKQPLLNALQHVLNPTAILLRNDTAIRELEGLNLVVEPLLGSPPENVMLEENGVKFLAPIWKGQKTGWFYDHRMNRARLADYVRGKRVLDVFSYMGGWGIQAACFGAKEVRCVDSSQLALEGVKQNAEMNHISEKIHTIREDAFDYLAALRKADEKFDVVILDPPAFIKRRRDMQEGKNAYHRLNELALHLLQPKGILVSASCSLHLSAEDLVDVVSKAGQRAGRFLQMLEQGHQGPDHPIHPVIVETNYLKAFIFYVD